MSGAAGHVTRKNGRIVEFPDRVQKSLRWLAIVALIPSCLMLLIGLFDARWVFPVWASLLLSIFPFGLAITALVGMLRTGKGGVLAFSFALVFMQHMVFSLEPYTNDLWEMLLTRSTTLIASVVVIYFFREDLRYNLRPFWYSLQAMRELQEMMMKQRMKRDAKKKGTEFDAEKVMDAEAVVRAFSAQSGKEIPKHMAGVTTKPGFRQQPKQKAKGQKSKAKRPKNR